MRHRNAVFAVLAAALLAGPALAQVPPGIAQQLRAIGRVVDTPRTGAIYAPFQRKPPYDGVKFVRDLKYGPGPMDRFDVFTPAAKSKHLRPVILFVHGGAFIGGDKNKDRDGNEWPFSDNIMLWAVAQDMVGVNIDYPLAPGATYPTVQKDIAETIVWIQKNIRRYGGDPNRVYLYGHSAGATQVATYVSHPEFYPGGKSGLRGAIMTSGTYQMSATDKPNVYFGAPETLVERSAQDGLIKTSIPLFFTTAELDPPAMVSSAQTLNKALCDAGKCPAFFAVLKDESHMSESFSVNTTDHSVTDPLLTFIKAH